MNLANCRGLRLVNEKKGRKGFFFEIDTEERVFLIEAISEAERSDWMTAIEDAVPETKEDEQVDFFLAINNF